MKILFLTTKLDFVSGGGSTIDRHNKALSLMPFGCEVKIITVFSKANKLKEKMPYQIFQENISYGNFFQFHRSIKSILEKYEQEADVYYIDGHIFSFGAGQYKKQSARPVIGHFDNYPPILFNTEPSLITRSKLILRKYIERTFLLQTYNLLDLFTFPSPIIRDIYIDFGLEQNKSIIIPAFMDLSIFQSQASKQFVCQNKKDAFHILYIGRLIQDKGLGVLLNALRLLDNYDLVLDIVGAGPDEQYFKKASQKLGVDDRVHWYPWVDLKNVGPIYRHAQVFVSPALWPEPFGMTTVEAMFCGLPVIVSSDTGPAWTARDGAGLIFKNGDAADLSEKIKQIHTDKDLGWQLSQKGLLRVDDFERSRLAGMLYKKMEELFNRR